MRYVDTRGVVEEPVEFTRAVVEGLAPGGGLFVPEQVPELSLDEICGLAEVPYAERAARVYRAFEPDLSDEQLAAITAGAYGDNFDTADICPVTALPANIFSIWMDFSGSVLASVWSKRPVDRRYTGNPETA